MPIMKWHGIIILFCAKSCCSHAKLWPTKCVDASLHQSMPVGAGPAQTAMDWYILAETVEHCLHQYLECTISLFPYLSASICYYTIVLDPNWASTCRLLHINASISTIFCFFTMSLLILYLPIHNIYKLCDISFSLLGASKCNLWPCFSRHRTCSWNCGKVCWCETEDIAYSNWRDYQLQDSHHCNWCSGIESNFFLV